MAFFSSPSELLLFCIAKKVTKKAPGVFEADSSSFPLFTFLPAPKGPFQGSKTPDPNTPGNQRKIRITYKIKLEHDFLIWLRLLCFGMRYWDWRVICFILLVLRREQIGGLSQWF